VVIPGTGIDSVRAIVKRDLDYSDRFQMIAIGDPGSSTGGDAPGGPLNYGLYKALGAEFAVELLSDGGKVTARLHDVGRSTLAQEQSVGLPPPTDANFRLAVHVLSDEIARWATGTPGIAATRILFVQNGRIWLMDSDGFLAKALTPDGQTSLSPAWSPDGRRMAFTRLVQAGAASSCTRSAPAKRCSSPAPRRRSTSRRCSRLMGIIWPMHDPTRKAPISSSRRSAIAAHQRLTAGRFADNLSPTYSPDGRRIAFISTRAGPPQLYAMGADGTDQELLAPFDFGVTGPSYAPEWSPDGASVVFHREVSGTPQIFVLTVAGQKLRQLTSQGRNEDATWAPDGRHLCFVSDRSGARQLWVIERRPVVSASFPRRAGPASSVVPAAGRARGCCPQTLSPGVMMRASSILSVLAAAALLVACGKKPAPEQPAPEPPAPAHEEAPPPPPPPAANDDAERMKREAEARAKALRDELAT
jgi:TolB protein